MLGAAVRLRLLHPELPGRPARLLDHDEPLDGRPAVLHPPLHRAVADLARRRRGRSRRRRSPAGAAAAVAAPTPRAGKAKSTRPRTRRREGAAAGDRRRRRRGARRSAPGGAADAGKPCRARPRARRSGSSTGIGLEGDGRRSTEDDEEITATVDGDGVGLLIGHHGQTIDAIQHLASRVALGDGIGPALSRRRRRRRVPRAPPPGARGPGRRRRRRGAALQAPGRARRDDAPASAGSCTSTCAIARTSRRTARATSPTGISSSRPAERFTFYARRPRRPADPLVSSA